MAPAKKKAVKKASAGKSQPLDIIMVKMEFGVTIGLPDYSSARVGTELIARVPMGHDPDVVRELLRDRLGAVMTKDVSYLTTIAGKIIDGAR